MHRITDSDAVGRKSFLCWASLRLRRAQIAREQGSAAPFTNLNARFEGNPGTGKTSVARLYAAFLVQLGALPQGAAYEETSGSELAASGPGQPGVPAAQGAQAGAGRAGTGLHGLLEKLKEARAASNLPCTLRLS